MRGIYGRKGEQFAYLQGDKLFTLEDEHTGYLREKYIVDLQENRIWEVVGDAIYSLDGNETIGYIGAEVNQHYFE
jgi:hypothetical protein